MRIIVTVCLDSKEKKLLVYIDYEEFDEIM